MYDLLVIGGGPAGYAAAIAAGRLGKRVAVFEMERIGGTCLNVGCIPTKYLLDKGAALQRIRQFGYSGIIKETGSFSYSRIVHGKDLVVAKLVDGVTGLMKRYGVELIRRRVEFTVPGGVHCDGKEYAGRNILIATGSKPWTPPIPGIEFGIDSSALLSIDRLPKRLAVIGGGVIGIELASALHAFGSQVTVLEMLPELLPNEEREVIKLLTNHLSRSGISLHTGAKVVSIRQAAEEKHIEWEQNGGHGTKAFDMVLVASGRKPNLDGIAFSKLGVKVSTRGNVVTDDRMMTNLPGVYAAGDVAGGWQLAHAAYCEAEIAVSDMFDGHFEGDRSVMPRCIYTIPPFAAVGLTQNEAESQGIKCRVGRFPFSANGMALAEDAENGIALVVSDAKTDKILGAHIFGEAAHELIATATMAIRCGLTTRQWESVIVPHPSLSEIVQEAALAGRGLARHIFSPSPVA